MPYDWKRHRDRSLAQPGARSAVGSLREDLLAACLAREGGPYPAYRDLRGRYALDGLDLELVRIQPDPFASPTQARLWIPWARLPLGECGLDPFAAILPGMQRTRSPGLIDPESARWVALRDFLGRVAGAWLERESPGGGKGPAARVVRHGQEVLDRSSVLLHPDGVELRLSLHLPARGRRILGRAAAGLLVELPERLLLHLGCLDPGALRRHIDTVEDFAALQCILEERRWIGFLADGSRLARRAGNDDRPLEGDESQPFVSPETLRREVHLPHAGRVTGMALPEGITLLCGGGFHGKSTLLRALGSALVPHVPGDGRELVAVRTDAQSIRAEDGRAIHEVDLRPFLRDLPLGRTTEKMTTENASGSTSQAAAILEAIQAGSRCLLIDEDTSATNFMIRDPLMEQLLARDREPIQPFLHQARTLFEELGVSSVLVVGGSGEYFRVADRVLVLDTYRPYDETERAKEIARERDPIVADPGEAERFRTAVSRDRLQAAGPPARGDRELRVRALDARTVLVEQVELNLGGIEALRDPSQARFLARVLSWRAGELSRRGPGDTGMTVAALERAFLREWERAGLNGFGDRFGGDLAVTRAVEVSAAVDRLRSRPAPRTDWGLESEPTERME